jgi:integrase
MPSVRARTDTGQLFLDFRWGGRRCREQTTLEDTPANRKRLEKVLAKIGTAIAAGTFDYGTFFPGSVPSQPMADRNLPVQQRVAPGQRTIRPAAPSPLAPTFRDFASQWLAVRRVEWRHSHLRTQVSTIDGRLLPHFGDRPIDQITRQDILTFRAALADEPGRAAGRKLSNKRINLIMTPLRQIMADASEQLGIVSPVTNIRPLKLRRTDVHPFSLDEVRLILKTARVDFRPYLTVRMFTAMRSGEVDGLKWNYVDFDRRQILIRETLVAGRTEYTKTDGSQREISMNAQVYAALRIQEMATRMHSEYVFCNREGKPLDNKNFTDRTWYPLLRHLNLQKRRPYQMRHTAATLWLAAGESPEWIARQLGHTTTEMLFKVYSRFVPNLTRQDGSAMERLLEKAFPAATQPPAAEG